MPSLTWSDELVLAHPQMDATHEEFVALLGAAETALAESREAGLAAYEVLVEHTVAHFGQEDRWMTATGFAPENCHSFQHAQVLGLMHEVARLAREQADFGPLGRVLPELGAWFRMHAQSMDAALASHLDQIGYDPATGHIARAPAAQGMTGCGGSSCSPSPQPGEPAEA
ncbi:hemerythrin domain-containing protein [Ideonella sp.]|uniref:hemerythrin domain-containing protein n=1 Tax=Ideonella sp. TaxID=1929293 RepID=UPI002B45DDF3|nr:hemerythrin domain-containing protein [Ideonella sp.]HJV68630.1 hemerythrin domain-containing protein [Ideonella sp.]